MTNWIIAALLILLTRFRVRLGGHYDRSPILVHSMGGLNGGLRWQLLEAKSLAKPWTKAMEIDQTVVGNAFRDSVTPSAKLFKPVSVEKHLREECMPEDQLSEHRSGESGGRYESLLLLGRRATRRRRSAFFHRRRQLLCSSRSLERCGYAGRDPLLEYIYIYVYLYIYIYIHKFFI